MSIKTLGKIFASLFALSIVLSTAVSSATCPGTHTVKFATCVGGASGMTLQLNPFKGLVRGCAPKIMDEVLKQHLEDVPAPVLKYAYTKVRMKSPYSGYSEPTSGWAANEVKFTGDKSDCEIIYAKGVEKGSGQNVILYAMVIRADSVLGLRFVVNRQYIYDFDKIDSSAVGKFVDENKNNAENDPDFVCVLDDIKSKTPPPFGTGPANQGINIEGGLSECYMDTGWRAIKDWNEEFAINVQQPQLYAPNFQTTQDNILAVAVMLIIYNKCIEQWTGGAPLNITSQMERMITAGLVDNWDAFFAKENGHMPLLNYYREPLSGTRNTYILSVMRGLKQKPNGTVLTGDYYYQTDPNDPANKNKWQLLCSNTGDGVGTYNVCSTDGVNYHRSGIPGLTCVAKPWETCPDYKPGGGVVNDAVDLNIGAHAYTFAQKFTPVTPPKLSNIRVAKFNGYEPYDFSQGNSLPGINGVPDVDVNLNTTYFPNVIDGKYPLWTYNHCFAIPSELRPNPIYLDDFVANFKLAINVPKVRAVGLIPLTDMHTEATNRTIPTSGPNAGRGPAFARAGFVSPITGEVVRDGMMMLLEDPSTPYDPIESLPDESYVEMRP